MIKCGKVIFIVALVFCSHVSYGQVKGTIAVEVQTQGGNILEDRLAYEVREILKISNRYRFPNGNEPRVKLLIMGKNKSFSDQNTTYKSMVYSLVIIYCKAKNDSSPVFLGSTLGWGSPDNLNESAKSLIATVDKMLSN
jgi:hypothetical protein